MRYILRSSNFAPVKKVSLSAIFLAFSSLWIACDSSTVTLDEAFPPSAEEALADVDTPIHCGQPLHEPTSFSAISRYVSQCSVRSIPDLLPVLPERLRQNTVLMRVSQSLQREGVNASHPRVILFSDDARLMLAFTGDESKPEARSLEAIEFDPTQKRFELFQIEFPAASREEARRSTRNAFVRRHPESCLRCHGGGDPKPVWAPYAFWPGAYGENDDRLQATSAPSEGASYLHFAQNVAPHSDRYRHVGYRRLRLDSEPRTSESLNSYLHRPNLQLTNALTPLLAQRAARIARESSAFVAQKASLYKDLLGGCDSSEVSMLSRPELAKYRNDQAAFDRFMSVAEPSSQPRRITHQTLLQNLPLAFDYRLGIDLRELAPSLRSDWAFYYDGRSFSFSQAILLELLRLEAVEHPSLEEAIRLRSFAVGGFDPAYAVEPSPELCVAIDALTGGEVDLPRAVRVRSVPDRRNVAQRHCSHCHTAGSGLIQPLHQPEELRALMGQDPDLIDRILRRLRAPVPMRMPRDVDLTTDEVSELEQYFRSLPER